MLVANLVNRLGRAAVPAEMDARKLASEDRIMERDLYQRVSRGIQAELGWRSTSDKRYRHIAKPAPWEGPLGEPWADTWEADVLATRPEGARVVIEFKVIRNGERRKETIENDLNKIKTLRGIHMRNNILPLNGYLAMLICDGVNLTAEKSISRINEWVGSGPLVTGEKTPARNDPSWGWLFPCWKV